jgi:hypothetical protein
VSLAYCANLGDLLGLLSANLLDSFQEESETAGRFVADCCNAPKNLNANLIIVKIYLYFVQNDQRVVQCLIFVGLKIVEEIDF